MTETVKFSLMEIALVDALLVNYRDACERRLRNVVDTEIKRSMLHEIKATDATIGKLAAWRAGA